MALQEGWKPWDFANFDEDEIPEEEYNKMLEPQYIPREVNVDISEEAQKALSNKVEPSEEAVIATDYGKSFIGKTTVYHKDGGNSLSNPLEQGEPYKLDNASFVYWCYYKAGVVLNDSTEHHPIQVIKNDPKLIQVGHIGSTIDPLDLTYGDIILLKGDKHIGLYIGEGNFISWVGSGYNNYSGGLKVDTLLEGKWKDAFQGHVLRVKKGATSVG